MAMSVAATLARAARSRAGLTQAEVADRAGLTQPEVARVERPGSNPTVATLEAVLRASGCRLAIETDPHDVDASQIAERLRLTPDERLRVFSESLEHLLALRAGARRVD